MPERIDEIFTRLQPHAPPPPPEFLQAVARRRRVRQTLRLTAAAALLAIVSIPALLLWPGASAPAPLPAAIADTSAARPNPPAHHLPTGLALHYLNRDLDIHDLILPEIAPPVHLCSDPFAPGRAVILDSRRISEIMSF